MSYFPMFVELKSKKVLIVGGGNVALRKLQKLRPYGADITVVAPEMNAQLRSEQDVTQVLLPFDDGMVDSQAMVIAATDNKALNHRIATLCRGRKIPVNVVDDREECSFIFPSLVKKGELSIGISTGGASPTAAIWCREQIESMLSDSLMDIVSYLDGIRPEIKAKFHSEEKRSAVFKKLFARCMELNRVLTTVEYTTILMEAEDNG